MPNLNLDRIVTKCTADGARSTKYCESLPLSCTFHVYIGYLFQRIQTESDYGRWHKTTALLYSIIKIINFRTKCSWMQY